MSSDSVDIDFVGEDKNKKFFHWTALHHAVDQNAIENVKSLIQFGASASAVNNNNETPLQMAIKKGNRKEIERVLMNENKVI